jgi:hypothetical protein
MPISIADFFAAFTPQLDQPEQSDPDFDKRIGKIREQFVQDTALLSRFKDLAIEPIVGPEAANQQASSSTISHSLKSLSLEVKCVRCPRCDAVFALRKTLKLHARTCV